MNSTKSNNEQIELNLLTHNSLNFEPINDDILNSANKKLIKLSSAIEPKIDDYAKLTSTYMIRGTLDSDYMMKNNFKTLSEKDKALSEILLRNYIDLKREEDSNLAIYVLRKVARNHLEIEFLKKIIVNIPLFQIDSAISSNCSNQILQKVSHCFYKKNEVIFNYGDFGQVFYLILKGSVLCLVPNNEYKEQLSTEAHFDQDATKKIKTNIFKLQRQNSHDKHHNPEFNVKNGQFQPPLSPLKQSIGQVLKFSHTLFRKDKKILRKNKSQSFSESDQSFSPEKADENKMLIRKNFPQFDIAKELLPGEGFGEIALLTGEKRTATVICSEDTHLLALSKKSFEVIVGAYKSFMMKDTVDFLQKFSFLKGMTSSHLLSLWQFMKEEKYSAGNIIYSERDECTKLYLIKSGEVEISQELSFTKNIQNSKEQEKKNKCLLMNNLALKSKMKQRVRICILGANSYFGAEELVKKVDQRESSIKCLTDQTIIYTIDKRKFLVFMKVHDYLRQFKEEVQMKLNWKEMRNNHFQNNGLQSLLIPAALSPQNHEIQSQSRSLSRVDGKSDDASFLQQQTNLCGQKISQMQSERRGESKFLNQQLSPSNSKSDLIKQQQQYLLFQLSKQKKRLPKLQSNLIEIEKQKNQRSTSLSQVINRQNKPLIETIECLIQKGYDLSQLTKLTEEELYILTRQLEMKANQGRQDSPSQKEDIRDKLLQKNSKYDEIKLSNSLSNHSIDFKRNFRLGSNQSASKNIPQSLSTSPSLQNITSILSPTSKTFQNIPQFPKNDSNKAMTENLIPLLSDRKMEVISKKQFNTLSEHRIMLDKHLIVKSSLENEVSLLNFDQGKSTQNNLIADEVFSTRIHEVQQECEGNSIKKSLDKILHKQEYSSISIFLSNQLHTELIRKKVDSNKLSSNHIFSSLQQRLSESPWQKQVITEQKQPLKQCNNDNSLNEASSFLKYKKNISQYSVKQESTSPKIFKGNCSRQLFKGSAFNLDKIGEKQIYKFEENRSSLQQHPLQSDRSTRQSCDLMISPNNKAQELTSRKENKQNSFLTKENVKGVSPSTRYTQSFLCDSNRFSLQGHIKKNNMSVFSPQIEKIIVSGSTLAGNKK